MLEAISNFIFEKELVFIHYVFITVIGGLIVWLIVWLLSVIWKVIKSIPVFKKVVKAIGYVINNMDINDFINIDERIKKGGKLKWYEKRGYEHLKRIEQEPNSKATQIYKPIYRDYGEGSGHNKEDT